MTNKELSLLEQVPKELLPIIAPTLTLTAAYKAARALLKELQQTDIPKLEGVLKELYDLLDQERQPHSIRSVTTEDPEEEQYESGYTDGIDEAMNLIMMLAVREEPEE